MDYSLLLAIHNLDEAQRERHQDGTLTPSGHMAADRQTTSLDLDNITIEHKENDQLEAPDTAALQRSKSLKGREGFNTVWEAITVKETGERPFGGIPARNAKGERLLLFIGIIDILQSYRLKKKLEHGWKSIVHDGDTVSVHRPSFYSKRFLDFMSTKVFKKLQGKEKTSPRKRSLGGGLGRARSMTEADRSRNDSRRERTLTEQSAEDIVSTSKGNTEQHKGSPDSGIPASPRNDSNKHSTVKRQVSFQLPDDEDPLQDFLIEKENAHGD
ncbi:phosphatidylinositol 4-phosphate 5-kinase type-1 gamma-like [Actinia tenebrosa]|uniref:Phosphatidylinositol 4-phosphate 5-kinase type-1 gamma-like n=1 Tax=Actinia tenebrosa TaxID=6105 RepID=A0A6P8H1E5_ACTTE|nr:phosphatidylinositol 4-phosphate 5-kinase type-1 gamma-like [Actinia tenebrosa]